MTADVDITIAFPGTARVAEGPFWNDRTRCLHWVDILAGSIHTGDPLAGGGRGDPQGLGRIRRRDP